MTERRDRDQVERSFVGQLFQEILGEARVTPRRGRWARLEELEARLVLSAPSLIGLPTDVTLIGGVPYYFALDGHDDNDEKLTFDVSADNNSFEMVIPENNQSLRISIVQENGNGGTTSYGDIVIELFEDYAPNTTSRIKTLAQNDVYDGLTFHRIIDGFMMQGGDTNGSTYSAIQDEFHEWLRHSSAGVAAMAKLTAPNTADTQFYITDVATPHLNDNGDPNVGGDHPVFGFVTEGDSVRDTVTALPTDSNDVPLDTVLMEEVEVFTDYENGVLMFRTPENYTGSGQLTIKVENESGEYQTYTMNVNVEAPVEWEEADPIEIDGDSTETVQVPEYDFSGIVYTANAYYGNLGVDVSIDSATGEMTISTSQNAAGLEWIAVTASYSDIIKETQYIPVFITPVAPELELDPGSDTGSINDDVTARNNEDDNSVLQFAVSNVAKNTELELLIDGEVVETTVLTRSAMGDGSGTFYVVLETVSGVEIADGLHDVTVRQFYDSFPSSISHAAVVSDASNVVALRIDTADPTFQSSAPTQMIEGETYAYNVQTDDEANDNVVYSLVEAPTGMTIDVETGLITWTPVESQVKTHSITVKALDLAGNSSLQTFDLEVQPLNFDLTLDGDLAVDEGDYVSFKLTAEGDGVEGPLTFQIENHTLPSGAVFSLAPVDGDSFSARFTWQTGESDGPGTYTVTISAEDVDGVTRTQTYTLTVNELNTPPTIDLFGPIIVVDEHQLAENWIEVSDPDLPANDIVFSIEGDHPAGATINPSTGRFQWTPGEAYGGGNYDFTIRATDSAGAYDEIEFTVQVNEHDAAPIVSGPTELDVMEGETLRFKINGYDPDDPSEALRFFVGQGRNMLEWHTPRGMTIDQATGEVVWNVPSDWLAEGVWSREVPIQIWVLETVDEQPFTPEFEGAVDAMAAAHTVRVTVHSELLPLVAAMARTNGPAIRPLDVSTPSPAPGMGRSTFNDFTASGVQSLPVDPTASSGAPMIGQISFGAQLSGGGQPSANRPQSPLDEESDGERGDPDSTRDSEATPSSAAVVRDLDVAFANWLEDESVLAAAERDSREAAPGDGERAETRDASETERAPVEYVDADDQELIDRVLTLQESEAEMVLAAIVEQEDCVN